MPISIGTGQKSEKKNLFRVSFLPDSGWSIPKKIVKKIQKRRSGFVSSQTKLGEAEKEIKNFRSQYCFYLTQARAFPKK